MEERDALVLFLRVDEVATRVVECVEHSEGLLLATLTHEVFPIYVERVSSAFATVYFL
jgi:hypothetical protein